MNNFSSKLLSKYVSFVELHFKKEEVGCLSKANPENLVPTTDLELHHSPQENNCITNILNLQMLCTGEIQHMKPIFKNTFSSYVREAPLHHPVVFSSLVKILDFVFS